MIHGKVEINGKPILGWQAIRTTISPGEYSDDTAIYAVEVYDYDSKELTRFALDHLPSDGAPELVRKIWAKYEQDRRNLTPYDYLV